MQQPSIFMQLLQVMDNLYVVAACVLVTIGIRTLWVRHLRAQEKIAAAETARAERKDKRGKARNAAAVPPSEPKKKKDITLEIIDTILIALILVFGLVRPFLLQTFFIPSGSMQPTLLIDDKLIANKLVYHFRSPERGQVIVFRPPAEAIIGNNPELMERVWLEKTSIDEVRKVAPMIAEKRDAIYAQLSTIPIDRQDFIKRVIGVPGDHIRIVANKGVFVNGMLLPETYLPDGVSESAISFPVPYTPGPPPQADQFLLSAHGQVAQENAVQQFNSRFVTWLRDWYLDQVYQQRIAPNIKDGEFIVPEGYVFAMGDNRASDGSFDSRYWGPVPISDVKARAISTFWPVTRLKLL